MVLLQLGSRGAHWCRPCAGGIFARTPQQTALGERKSHVPQLHTIWLTTSTVRPVMSCSASAVDTATATDRQLRYCYRQQTATVLLLRRGAYVLTCADRTRGLW